MQIKEKHPHSKISKIIEEIATQDADFLNDLDVMLGNIARYKSGDDEIVMGYKALQTAITREKPNIPDNKKTPNPVLEKCTKFYKENPELKTHDFLEHNDESTIAGLFLLVPEAKKSLFASSKKWILPQKIHLKIKNIKQDLSSVPPSAENAILHVKKGLTETKVELAKTKVELTETKRRIVELEQANTERDERLSALEVALKQLISKSPPSSVGENISIDNTSNEASAGQKRSREDGQPSSITQSSDETTKVSKAKTPERSPD
jgi:hypothetical protein